MAQEFRIIVHNGITDSLSGWATRLGISKQAMHSRLKRLPFHKAMDKNCGRNHLIKKHSKKRVEGKVMELVDIVYQARNEIEANFTQKELNKIEEIKRRRELLTVDVDITIL